MIPTSITRGPAGKAHCRRRAHFKCTHWEKHCGRDIINCYHQMVPTRPNEFTYWAAQSNELRWVVKVFLPDSCHHRAIGIHCLSHGNQFQSIRYQKKGIKYVNRTPRPSLKTLFWIGVQTKINRILFAVNFARHIMPQIWWHSCRIRNKPSTRDTTSLWKKCRTVHVFIRTQWTSE